MDAMPRRRIKLSTTLAGPQMSGQPGHVVEMAEDLAAQIVAQGYAVFVDEQPETDAAQPAAPAPLEQATIQAPERRRGGKRK